jgi:hypothetical protein
MSGSKGTGIPADKFEIDRQKRENAKSIAAVSKSFSIPKDAQTERLRKETSRHKNASETKAAEAPKVKDAAASKPGTMIVDNQANKKEYTTEELGQMLNIHLKKSSQNKTVPITPIPSNKFNNGASYLNKTDAQTERLKKEADRQKNILAAQQAAELAAKEAVEDRKVESQRAKEPSSQPVFVDPTKIRNTELGAKKAAELEAIKAAEAEKLKIAKDVRSLLKVDAEQKAMEAQRLKEAKELETRERILKEEQAREKERTTQPNINIKKTQSDIAPTIDKIHIEQLKKAQEALEAKLNAEREAEEAHRRAEEAKRAEQERIEEIEIQRLIDEAARELEREENAEIAREAINKLEASKTAPLRITNAPHNPEIYQELPKQLNNEIDKLNLTISKDIAKDLFKEEFDELERHKVNQKQKKELNQIEQKINELRGKLRRDNVIDATYLNQSNNHNDQISHKLESIDTNFQNKMDALRSQESELDKLHEQNAKKHLSSTLSRIRAEDARKFHEENFNQYGGDILELKRALNEEALNQAVDFSPKVLEESAEFYKNHEDKVDSKIQGFEDLDPITSSDIRLNDPLKKISEGVSNPLAKRNKSNNLKSKDSINKQAALLKADQEMRNRIQSSKEESENLQMQLNDPEYLRKVAELAQQFYAENAVQEAVETVKSFANAVIFRQNQAKEVEKHTSNDLSHPSGVETLFESEARQRADNNRTVVNSHMPKKEGETDAKNTIALKDIVPGDLANNLFIKADQFKNAAITFSASGASKAKDDRAQSPNSTAATPGEPFKGRTK